MLVVKSKCVKSTIYSNETSILYQEDDELIDRDEDGLFNVSSILVYDPEVLTETFYYICELSIPGTPFSINETRIHKLGNYPYGCLAVTNTTAAFLYFWSVSQNYALKCFQTR